MRWLLSARNSTVRRRWRSDSGSNEGSSFYASSSGCKYKSWQALKEALSFHRAHKALSFFWLGSQFGHSQLTGENASIYIEGNLSASCQQSRYYRSSNFLQSLHCWCEEVLFPQIDQAFFFWKCWLDANLHDISMSNFHFEVSFWWIVQFHISFLFVWGCCSISWFLTRGSRNLKPSFDIMSFNLHVCCWKCWAAMSWYKV